MKRGQVFTKNNAGDVGVKSNNDTPPRRCSKNDACHVVCPTINASFNAGLQIPSLPFLSCIYRRWVNMNINDLFPTQTHTHKQIQFDEVLLQ